MSIKSIYSMIFSLHYIKKFSGWMTIVYACVFAVGCSVGSTPVTDADNDQVITLGDSIFDLNGEIQAVLESYAGETFRRYTQNGAELEGGVITMSVLEQYAMAKSDNSDIETIVMDGGGNDILLPALLLDPYHCKTHWYQFGSLSEKCRNFIDDIYVDAANLLNNMYTDDVKNVIYLGYYHTKNGIFALDSLEEAVDYGDKRLSDACENSAVNCVFIDPRSKINDNDIILDGIHPTVKGSKKLADLIWPELRAVL